MIPASFDEANMVIDKPDCLSRDQCDPLNVFVGTLSNMNVILSCFKVTQKELDEINRTGRVWLFVYGTQMPIVMMSGVKPEIHLVPGDDDGESVDGS